MRQTILESVIANEFELVGAFGLCQLVLVGRIQIDRQRNTRLEVDSNVVFEEVEVGLPQHRHHQRVDPAGVVVVVLLILVHIGIGRVGKSSLHKLQVDSNTTHEALFGVVTPRDSTRRHTPDGTRLLHGIESRIGHTRTTHNCERMLCRGPTCEGHHRHR